MMVMLPDDRLGEMFETVRGRLGAAGLAPYEISNFARPGFECRHNLNYWNYGEWIGFGAGAVSHLTRPLLADTLSLTRRGNDSEAPSLLRRGLGEVSFSYRRQNVRDLKKYLAGQWEQETETISHQTAMGEFLMMGLRKKQGIRSADFENKFGEKLTTAFPIVDNLRGEGWIKSDGSFWWMTPKGLPVANSILEKFL